ncbi:MAG: 3-hydroxyacyl-CoA dehydrogenase family protein [Polyangiales bacterium]
MHSEIDSIAVIGTGQMGRGIAQVATQAGLSVQLCDRDADIAMAGKQHIGKQLERLVQKGRLSKDAAEAAKARLQVVATPAALPPVAAVIEAVSEEVTLKQRIFQSLAEALPDSTILASNTSSVSITLLASAVKAPERVVGLHFFNPVPVMPLVELIAGLRTSKATLETAGQLAAALGKEVVRVQDAPAFTVNRILMPLVLEACHTLQEGLSSMADIDKAVKLGLNHPMGPFELADFVGLDTVLAIAELLHRETGDPKFAPPRILRQHVTAGFLGRKSGRGFYDYQGDA